MKKLVLCLFVFTVAGCATTEGVTSFTNGADTSHRSEKENRLWYEAAEYDTTIARSGEIYNDPGATRYLQSVMDRLYPEFKGKIHVHIYNSTRLNAFALADGSIYFNLGLLARIHNEAQAATVLGHEAAHFIKRHAFKERARTKNMAAFAVSGIPLSRLAATSSVMGYSRDLEREADNLGYQRMVRAGYDPHQSYEVFQYLAAEIKAEGTEEPYFFSSHPKLVERIEHFKELSKKARPGGRVGTYAYNKYMGPLRLAALREDLGQDRYKSIILVMTDKDMRKYYPPAGYYYLGEAYTRRDEKGDSSRAMRAYGEAARLAPKFAQTYMTLGMHYMKKGRKQQARGYFERYLRLAPRDARDRAFVQSYVRSLK